MTSIPDVNTDEFDYFLEASEEDKIQNFGNFGWELTLIDTENEYPSYDYPLTHFDIYIDDEYIEDVIDELDWVRDYCAPEDIAIFINDMRTPCHNSGVGMRSDYDIAMKILKKGWGKITLNDPEEIDYLVENGLGLQKGGYYSSIGQIMAKDAVPTGAKCIEMTDKSGFCFVPQEINEIDTDAFLEWYDKQDRFRIRKTAGDLSDIQECCQFIEMLKNK